MKNIFVILMLICSTVASGQVREIIDAIKPKKQYEGTPVLQKNSQILSFTTSFPNNLSSFLDFGGFGSFISTNKKKAGPFNLRYEYLIKDNIGLGASLSFASAEETYKNPFGSGSVTGKISGFSFLLSSYYHFYTTNKFDTYTKGSIGINLWSGSYYDQNGSETKKFSAPTPIAYNAILGLRYFVTPKLCLSGEFGYGNFKLSAGIGAGIKLN